MNKDQTLKLKEPYNSSYLHRLRIFFILIAILLGFLYAWSSRHSMSSDGMSYIDMADSLVQGDPNGIINALWSPLYPILLSFGLSVFNPTSYWEFSVVHLVNFLIFLFSLFTFDFFIKEALNYRRTQTDKNSKSGNIKIPDWAILSLGYTLFIQSSINLIKLWTPTPDMLFSAFVYLSSGIILRIAYSNKSLFNYILLGLTLGLGCLTKAAMFPLAFIFLVVAILGSSNFKQTLPKICLSLILLIGISAPYINSLSKSQGHFTLGESGKINYAWYINEVPLFTHWQGVKGTTGTKGKENPVHPTRQVFDSPPIYEFGSPVSGTYPPWLDPIYWYKGVRAHFDPVRTLTSIGASMEIFIDIFCVKEIALVFCILLLFYMSGRKRKCFQDIDKQWIFIIPAIFSFVMFSVVHLEDRYIAAFIVILWIGILFAVELPKTEFNHKLIECVTGSALIILMLSTCCFSIVDIYGFTKNASIHYEWIIAKALNNIGFKNGDKVASIGYKIPTSQYWARVGKFKIVSEIVEDDTPNFWSANGYIKSRAINAFRKTGAKVIVAKDAPSISTRYGWKKIEGTEVYYYLL